MLVGILVSALGLPQLSSASAAKVSRSFGEDFAYFPQTNGAGIVYAGGKFYKSSDPAAEGSWSETQIDLKNIARFTGTRAVRLKHHDYIIAGHNITFGSSIDYVPNQIWRMKRSDPTTLKKVAELPEKSDDIWYQFVDLVKYNRVLFASDWAGNLWRSGNGKDWQKVTLSGFSINSPFSTLYAGSQALYASDSIGDIYASTNGKTWEKVLGSYEDGNNSIKPSLAEFDGRIYVSNFDANTHTTHVWRMKSNGDFKQVYENGDSAVYTLRAGSEHLYLTGYNLDANTFTVSKLAHGGFTKNESGDGKVTDMLEASNRVLLVVNQNNAVSLWDYAGL